MVHFRTAVTAYHLPVLPTDLALILALGFFLLFLLKLILVFLLLGLDVRVLCLDDKKLRFGICVSFFIAGWDGLIAGFLMRIIWLWRVGLYVGVICLCRLDRLENVISSAFRVIGRDGATFEVCVFTFASRLSLPSFVVKAKTPFSSSHTYQHSFSIS